MLQSASCSVLSQWRTTPAGKQGGFGPDGGIIGSISETIQKLAGSKSNVDTFRAGDGLAGRLLTNVYFANSICMFLFGLADFSIGGCEGQAIRGPAEKVDLTTNALPEAILYDVTDGSIELVYSCEYIPYVANVPGAPDTEWSQL